MSHIGGDEPTWESSLAGERTEVYGVDVLAADESLLFTMPYDPGDGSGVGAGVTGGSVSFNLDDRVVTGCQLSFVRASGLVDWMSNRLRPWVSVNGQRWNLGVFIPSSPDDAYTADAIRQDVTGLGKTSLLDGDSLDAPLSLSAGAQVVAWVELMIAIGTGESVTDIVPSDETLLHPLTWPAGTSRLDVINDLLGAIGYNPLWSDREGAWRSELWIYPANLAPGVVFAEGAAAIHSPTFTASQNTTGVPNKVICMTTGDDQNPGMISVATNEDPNSPYSYSRRGEQWVTKVYDGVEATSQAILDGIAAKNLKLNSTPPYYLSVTHAVVPLDGRQVVQFTSAGVDRQVVVNEWGVTMTPGALMTGKWLGVSS